ncbi:MAG: sigma-70 family RNA polymerase sigma factor [Candidatus Gastranaerophilales bacterium]|nr:sigma-70 family RNA polymerase sigma factor [Candidatus Gastranaerophilales bacterium]
MNREYISLISKAQKGDQKAMIDLIRKEENNIYSTIYYLKKSDDEINDIMQDVLIKLSTKITQLKNPKLFKSWLNQIIIHSYYDYLRKNKKQTHISFKNDDKELDIIDYKSNPQDSVLYNELDRIVKKSIENLPMHYKIPITLREVQGLSYSDISNITQTSIGTVKSRIARARNIVQDSVKKYKRD